MMKKSEVRENETVDVKSFFSNFLFLSHINF